MEKRYILPLVAAMMLCLPCCADNDEVSSSKSSVVEAQTVEVSTAKVNEKAETTIDEIQKALDEQTKAETQKTNQNGLQKHTNRKEEGYYLEDYITINFIGYEHDSEVEVFVDWKKLAKDIGNDISTDLLEAIYRIKVLNTDDRPIDHTRVDDLVNGDTVELCIYENTLDKEFKKQYSKELKYIEDNVWYYDKTPVIVSGLK